MAANPSNPTDKQQSPLRQLFINFGSKTYAELAETAADNGTVLHLNEGMMRSMVLTAASRRFIIDAGRLIATDDSIKPTSKKDADQQKLIDNVAPLVRKLLLEDESTTGDTDGTDNGDFLYEVARVLFADPTVYKQYRSWNRIITQTPVPQNDQRDVKTSGEAYGDAYRAFGWLTDDATADEDSDLCKQTLALREAITNALRDHRQAGKTPEANKAGIPSSDHPSALSAFMDDMKHATPATFGAWATDTSARSLLNNALTDCTGNTSTNTSANGGCPTELARRMEQWRGHATPKDADAASLLGALYDAAQPAVAINPRVMFVFLNWGDNLNPSYPRTNGFGTPYSYDGSEPVAGKPDVSAYHDWSEPLFSATDDAVWSHGSMALLSRETDFIGRFVRATHGTPLQGAFMTDFYKGIATPNATQLDKAIRNSHNGTGASADTKMVDKAMLELLALEISQLNDAIPRPAGVGPASAGAGVTGAAGKLPSARPLIFAVTDPFKAIKSCRTRATKPTDLMADVEPWQVIRWPHHSGSNGATFKASTLAYAYGRAAYALEEAFPVETPSEPDGESAVKARFPFDHEVADASLELKDGGKSLYAWFDSTFRVCTPTDWAGQRTGKVAVRIEALMMAHAKASSSSEVSAASHGELKGIVDGTLLTLGKELRARAKRPVDEIPLEKIRQALFAEDFTEGDGLAATDDSAIVDDFMRALANRLRQQGKVNRTMVRNAVLELVGRTPVLYVKNQEGDALSKGSKKVKRQSAATLAEAFAKGWVKEKELIEQCGSKSVDFDRTLAYGI